MSGTDASDDWTAMHDQYQTAEKQGEYSIEWRHRRPHHHLSLSWILKTCSCLRLVSSSPPRTYAEVMDCCFGAR